MPVEIKRGTKDKVMGEIETVLEDYLRAHPTAAISMYRQNSVSIRIRVIDPSFAGKSKADRYDLVWSFLYRLPEDVQGDISQVLPLTPSELKSDFANLEYENPIPSAL